MKIFRSLSAILAILLFFTACQRETSFENGITSTGTLKSVSGDCLGATLNGIYKAGTTLSTSNYLDIQLDVAAIGKYRIVSDTINGFSFKGEGEFTSTGFKTVRLKGTGTPLSASTNNFTIRYGTSSCNIIVTTLGANVTNATFTYSTATDGSCTGAVLGGAYKIGVATDASNTVKLGVNVTTPGTYTINVAAVNGIAFSATGIFATTGVQTVTLTASGTPSAIGSFNYAAAIGTSSCTFSVATADNIPQVAVFTLGGAGSTCTGFILAGSYIAGAPVTAANTAAIQVNVTTAGTFTLTTATVNGISFSANGTFIGTGTTLVILTATGTPTTSGLKTFVVTAGTATCSFDISFAAAPVSAIFTLSGTPGACTAFTVNGAYQAFSPLGSSNTVVVKVDVTTAGTYSLATNIVNGMQFKASGVFAAAGLGIAVTLTGSGNPAAAGTASFSLAPIAGGNACSFDVPVTAAPSGILNCKVDGVYASFADGSAAEVFDNFTGVPVPYLYLGGYTASTNGGFSPQLQLFIINNDNSAVTTGTYDENHWIPPGKYRIEIDLHLENADQSVTIWNTSSNFLPPANPPFTIAITSRTSSRIKGTFSGQLTNTLQGSTLRKVITEGVFDLPIH
jgi:hypothetical protein